MKGAQTSRGTRGSDNQTRQNKVILKCRPEDEESPVPPMGSGGARWRWKDRLKRRQKILLAGRRRNSRGEMNAERQKKAKRRRSSFRKK